MTAMLLMHESWGAWPWFAPLWILLWIVVIATVVPPGRPARRLVVRAAVRGGRGPQEILADRFARGEIDASEYRARLDTLRQ